MKEAVLLFDGGSRGNPGPSGCGYVIMNSEETKIITTGCKFIGVNTNNYAEYMGMIFGLQKALELNISSLIVKGDSMLVIKQMLKQYSVKAPNLIPLYNYANNFLNGFEDIKFYHIKRNLNTLADKLANQAMNNNKIESNINI